MQYNECKICGAKDGRAGILWGVPSLGIEMACQNCYETKRTGNVVIFSHLIRSEEELQRTINILTTEVV